MRLVVVSNRLPIALQRHDERWSLKRSSGGLVTALTPVLRRFGGLWIGWPGISIARDPEVQSLFSEFADASGYSLEAVHLTEEETEDFYHGFANEIIWPLFHDMHSNCNFEPHYWEAFQSVNRKFADVIEPCVQSGDYIWIHDYHLMGVGAELRARRVPCRLGFFLHIPFPGPDVFRKLPWREQLLDCVLAYDLAGFQTPRDVYNLHLCFKSLRPTLRLSGKPTLRVAEASGRSCRIGAFPISIDYQEFAQTASHDDVTRIAEELEVEFLNRPIVLGLDRLDYTKGILYRLKAIREALRRYPELHRSVTFVQVVVPSREGVERYRELKADIEQLVSEINGEFTQPGWVPIHHIFRSVDRTRLLGLYRIADVAMVTPLKDGMNLVAKEYCACQIDEDGVLILSEFAGAASELERGALLVNPHDREGVAAAIYEAITMDMDERRQRMRRLRSFLRKHDVYWWVSSFLRSSGVESMDGMLSDVRPPAQPVLSYSLGG